MNNETILTIDGGEAVELEFSGDPFVALDSEIEQTGEPDYNYLKNKPAINGETLIGDKSFEDLGDNVLTNIEIKEIFDKVFKKGE